MRMSKFLSRANYRNETWTEHAGFPARAVQYWEWIKENRFPTATLKVYSLDPETNEVVFIPEEQWSEFLVSR